MKHWRQCRWPLYPTVPGSRIRIESREMVFPQPLCVEELNVLQNTLEREPKALHVWILWFLPMHILKSFQQDLTAIKLFFLCLFQPYYQVPTINCFRNQQFQRLSVNIPMFNWCKSKFSFENIEKLYLICVTL